MSPGIVGAAFAAGVLSFFSPCILPLLPVYVGLLTTGEGEQTLGLGRRMANTLAFVLGISVTFLILGLGAGAIGQALRSPAVAVTCGVVIFIFGLHLAGVVRIPLLNREKRADLGRIDAGSVAGAFLLGLGFSFGWTPCVGPILGSVLALAAQQGTAAAGAGLTLVYALGMSIPFLVITLAWSVLATRVRKLNRFLPTIQRVGGALIAIVGVWMIVSQVNALEAASSPADADAPAAQVAGEQTQADAAPSSTGQADDAWRHVALETADGQTRSIADFEGTPLYVKFWASW